MSKMQRELPGQLSSATTDVNAKLADAIRQGKLSGLSGLSNIGSQMGGMASAESGRQLQAGIANQGAGLQAAGLTQQSLNNYNQAQLGALNGQVGLYGTTPAMAATFGNQALNSTGQQLTAEQMRNQQSLGYLNTQNQSYASQPTQQPWWQQVLGGLGSIAPYLPKSNSSPGGYPNQSEMFPGQGFIDENGNYIDGYSEGGYSSPYFPPNSVPPGGTEYGPEQPPW
jgi:hypothetical protein